MSTSKFESAWDAVIDNPDEDFKKRSDYLILIQARLYGQSGSVEDKAEQFGLPVSEVNSLMNGKINKFSLSQLIAIARRIGITARV